jgi:serine/threonine protein kinase
MGVVYLAHNALMGRDEVLKVMGREIIGRPGVLDRFIREIRAVAKLRHANIVAAYSAVRLGESIVFSMEYVEGLDLSKMVKLKGPMPVAHACSFIYQAALGLQHAHEEGLVHRDIKPGNLMLSRKGDKAIVKILDFGLSKVTREAQIDTRLTHEGQALGTPDFIAPEQILDAQSADIRADIYSLGATLYYLLAGRPPFQATSLYDMYQAHISRDADPLNLIRPDVPAELAALVAKMMVKDPARRFQTPGEVAQTLIRFFRPSAAQRSGSSVEVSQINPQTPQTRVSAAGFMPTQPATPVDAPVPRTSSRTGADGVAWESLIEIKDDEPLVDVVKPRPAKPKPSAAEEPIRRPPWGWLSVAAVALLLGLFAVWAVVLRVKTSNGIIELVNLPENAEVFVDDGEVRVAWPEGGKFGVITATAGKHKIKVKKDGLETSGEDVTVQAGDNVRSPFGFFRSPVPAREGMMSMFATRARWTATMTA